MDLKVYKLDKNAELPYKATEESSCFDIHSCFYMPEINVHQKGGLIQRQVQTNNATQQKYIPIYPGERVVVNTGLILDIPTGYDVKVYPRSGMSLKNGITLCNSIGVIDEDYKEELYIILINNSSETYLLYDNIRVAQIELCEKVKYNVKEVKTKPKKATSRDGGLGSTGETTESEKPVEKADDTKTTKDKETSK